MQVLRRRQAGELSSEEFNRIADEAVLAAIKYQEDAGVDIVTDGEMRRDNFGVHVCRGNWSRKEEVLLKGNYGPLLPYLMQMNVDQLVLEMATPRAGELEVFKEYRNEKEIGLGVVNPRTDEVEDPARIVQQVKRVLQFFAPEKIYLNPDCGFGTFAERCVNTPETAYRKLKAIHEAAQMLRQEYA